MISLLELALVFFGEEGRLAAGVPEQDGFISDEEALADQVDQPGGGATGVDGVEQETFLFCEEGNRLAFRSSEDAVAGGAVIGVDQDLVRGELEARAEAFTGVGGQLCHVHLQVTLRLVNADAEHPAGVLEKAGAENQPGVGAAGGGGKDDPVRFNTLVDEFLHGEGVSERAGGAGAAVGDKVGFVSLGLEEVEGFLQERVAMRPVSPNDFGSKELIQEEVGAGLRGRFADENKDAAKAEPGGGSGGLAAVVGLQGPGGEERVGSQGLGFGDEEFQFAGLVAAEGEAGLVITLDEEMRAGEGFFEAGEGIRWGWGGGRS